MKRSHKTEPAQAVQHRVPYPQTADTAAAWIKAHGMTVADLARYNQVPRPILVDLLRGRLCGNYGKAHQGAIVLGLKPEPAGAAA